MSCVRECETEYGQALPEFGQHHPRVRLSLKAHDEVVGIAHDHDATARLPASPLLDPEIEDVAQDDVGEERADARTLRRPLVGFLLLAALEDTGPQP